jgi:hypothetical protein
LTKSDQEKRQEMIAAYLDDSLSPKDRQRVEKLLASDEALRADLEGQRSVKDALASLPQVSAPRSFVLDPSLYGRPSPQRGLKLYPVLRTATVVAMFVFIALVSVDVLVPESGAVSDLASAVQMDLEEERSAEESGDLAFEMVQESEQGDGLTLSEEPAAEAPTAEEAVEEVTELEVEDSSKESGNLATPLDAAEGLAPPMEEADPAMAQEAAPAAGEPIVESEGDAAHLAPTDDESARADGAVIGTRASEIVAGQVLSGTQASADRFFGGALLTAAAETVESPEATPQAISTPTLQAAPEIVQTPAEVIVAIESPAAGQTGEMSQEPAPIEESASGAKIGDDERSIFTLDSLRLAEICLGLSVLFLLIFTLLFRVRLRRGI